MSNERETKVMEIAGHTLKVLTFITGYDQRAVQEAILAKLNMTTENGKAEVSGMNTGLLLVQKDEYVKLIVKEFDGKTENILDAIMNLPVRESEAIQKVISDISEGKEVANNLEQSPSTSMTS